MAHPTGTGQSKVSMVYAEATGSVTGLLAVAEQQRFFEKCGVNVQSIAVGGAAVPRLTSETPIGMIGEPAALLQAAEGVDLRIVASLSKINLSGHLVARPEIRNPKELRGKQIGVRVIGGGYGYRRSWLSNNWDWILGGAASQRYQ